MKEQLSIIPGDRIEGPNYIYEAFDPATYKRLMENTLAIKRGMRDAVETIFDVGARLQEVKQVLEPYGWFHEWLRGEFGMEPRMAQLFMNVSQAFEGENFSHLRQLPASAQYLLAAPSTPQEARLEAVAQVKAGKKLTYTQVKNMVKPGHGAKAGMFTSSSDDYWTPDEVVEAAVGMFTSINLDPCSNDGEPNIPADLHYRKEDDGLSQQWVGRVYVNPPYSRIGDWVDKLVEELKAGEVSQALLLVPARTDTQWWKRLADLLPPVCLIEGRLSFKNAEGPAPFPSAVFYFGPDVSNFYFWFDELGKIWQPFHPESFGAE